jgi:hypothetical protein
LEELLENKDTNKTLSRYYWQIMLLIIDSLIDMLLVSRSGLV